MAETAVKIRTERILVSSSRLVMMLGITDKTLTNWEREGCPKAERGWWNLEEVLLWRGLIGTEIKQNEEPITLAQKKIMAEIEYKETRNELAKLQTEIANGKYVVRELVESELSRFFVILKTSCSSLPKRLINEVQHLVDPLEARRILKTLTDLTNNALEQMSVEGVYRAPKKKK